MRISDNMASSQANRLSDHELNVLFDRLFPQGFAGADVLAEVAPEGWEHSPLLACFHPSVEQVFEERLMFHRNTEGWRQLARKRQGQTIEEQPNQHSKTSDASTSLRR